MQLLYFAWVRERIGTGAEARALPAGVTNVAGLLDWLSTLSPGHAAALADRRIIRVAVDQDFVGPEAVVTDTAEVAIFPPVTGG